MYFVNYLTIFTLIRVLHCCPYQHFFANSTSQSQQTTKTKALYKQAYNTMNLKLYQKIYIVTNEQCIRLTVLNVRFQRYLRGQSTVLLPAEHCALSLIKCPTVQYNLRAKYTIIVVIFHFSPDGRDRRFATLKPTVELLP